MKLSNQGSVQLLITLEEAPKNSISSRNLKRWIILFLEAPSSGQSLNHYLMSIGDSYQHSLKANVKNLRGFRSNIYMLVKTS